MWRLRVKCYAAAIGIFGVLYSIFTDSPAMWISIATIGIATTLWAVASPIRHHRTYW